MSPAEHYIAQQTAPWQALLWPLRDLILAAHPGMAETLKWQVPFYTCYGLLCYLNKPAKHARLEWGFYRGTLLEDPGGLLQGTGKMVRHVHFTEHQAFDPVPLQALLQEAIDVNQKLAQLKLGR
jgi:hypothetical protein